MNEQNQQLAATLIEPRYLNNGLANLTQYNKHLTTLLSSRQLPTHGWPPQLTEYVIQQLSAMDTNNHIANVGLGEREGRCVSQLVHRRHYGLTHGIGRSGDLYAQQPKAAGSSLLVQLAHILTTHALKLCGINNIHTCIILPTATGMSITLSLLALRQHLNDSAKQYVLWPRVDQKTCLKAIISSGYTPIIIPNKLVGDEVQTDMDAVQAAIEQYTPASIVCIVTTTSCFAPRAPDNVVAVAELCKQHNITHIVNNAYGLQASHTCKLINTAHNRGRVDCVIQSTDKNFGVPVGGAIVFDYDGVMTKQISHLYPGRASNTAHVDMFLTLLGLGQNGLIDMLQQRQRMYDYLKQMYTDLAEKFDERLLHTASNPISLAITVDNIAAKQHATYLGSMLYSRSVSGPRCISSLADGKVDQYAFKGYGAHYDSYPAAYLTAAAAIGLTADDIDEYRVRLDKAIVQMRKHISKQSGTANGSSGQAADTQLDVPEI